jgi:phage terminase large subunit
MEIPVKLYRKQFAFVTCNERFTAFIGGIGSGKTHAGAVKSLRHIEPGTLGLVVAPTYPMLRDATLRTFIEVAERGIADFHKGEMRIVADCGGEVLFRSADTPDRLRGPNIAWAWIDEAALCPKQTWDIVIGRLRQHGKAGPCWVTSTPKGKNWLYERSNEMRIFKASTEDNPYLDNEFVQSLKAAYSGNFAQQELYAEFIGFEGLIYDFDTNIHVCQRPADEMVRWLAGVDEGYTNPAVILAIGEDADGRLHIFKEYYRRNRLQDQVVSAAVEMRDEFGLEYFLVDSSAAGLIAAMHAVGLPAWANKSRVLDGIAQIQNRLAVAGDGRPRLTVSPSCVNTIAEFESYCWKETRIGTKDEPEKANDHAMDALRYAVAYVDGQGWIFG